jgi:sulfur-oxidizing protein SoxX
MRLPNQICRTSHVTLFVFGLLLSFPFSASAQKDMSQPLQGFIGQADRGRALVSNKQKSLCLLCHQGPFPEDHFQGNLAPDLGLIAQRLDTAQLRARMVDASQFNPQTIMPSYYRTEGLTRVLQSFKGKTILTAQEIEDVIAFLETLKP